MPRRPASRAMEKRTSPAEDEREADAGGGMQKQVKDRNIDDTSVGGPKSKEGINC